MGGAQAVIPIHSHEGLATRLKPIPFCTALKIPYSFAPALSDCDLAYQERRFGNCSVVLLQVKSLETEPLLQLKAFLARHAESPILFEVQLASYERGVPPPCSPFWKPLGPLIKKTTKKHSKRMGSHASERLFP